MSPTDSPEASWSDARARWAVWSTGVLAGVAVLLLAGLVAAVANGVQL